MAQGDAEYLLVKIKQDRNYFEKCEGQTCYNKHQDSRKHGDLSCHYNEDVHKGEINFENKQQSNECRKKEKKKGLKKE